MGEQKIRVKFEKEKDGETVFMFDEIIPKNVLESMVLKI